MKLRKLAEWQNFHFWMNYYFNSTKRDSPSICIPVCQPNSEWHVVACFQMLSIVPRLQKERVSERWQRTFVRIIRVMFICQAAGKVSWSLELWPCLDALNILSTHTKICHQAKKKCTDAGLHICNASKCLWFSLRKSHEGQLQCCVLCRFYITVKEAGKW